MLSVDARRLKLIQNRGGQPVSENFSFSVTLSEHQLSTHTLVRRRRDGVKINILSEFISEVCRDGVLSTPSDA